MWDCKTSTMSQSQFAALNAFVLFASEQRRKSHEGDKGPSPSTVGPFSGSLTGIGTNSVNRCSAGVGTSASLAPETPYSLHSDKGDSPLCHGSDVVRSKTTVLCSPGHNRMVWVLARLPCSALIL